ncbi:MULTISPECIES: type IV pilus biogenesis protein PilM [Pseudidiomarina]|uniref:Type IV pilus assembly protein PilM n=4 Tax=Pseudidiomarina TaxID=2800384 RepID=A0A368UPX2_9GAMM|nr:MULTISPECIES: type IV pilus assembly protein PilM [Pseudidiomarina]MDT7526029.1 pilus assembly protein PilM [Pseudidiomarina sp. GXY010]MDX1526176.1 type IV pilus assembly protein PilM [Pseudidiomarina maritima]PWW10429.1 type IV pilus assembly protein PilM [Pseudidiomarina maritima]RBP88069.1 type IV pilus assembly protein PilM [Pseudidiomarina tainanensis]RCW30080.1 type IV pilus assembly protein PilM [Pseudidiomarina tainanensis]
MGLFGFGKKPGLGIDISAEAVRGVEIMPTDNSYSIEHVAEVTLAKQIMDGDEIVDIDKLGKMIAQLRKRMGHARVAVAAISGNQAMQRIIAMDIELDDEAIGEKIESDPDLLSVDTAIDHVYDYESLGEHPSLPGQQRVMLMAARASSVSTRSQAIEAGGYKVAVMDVDNHAVARTCNHVLPHLYPDVAASNLPYVVVDIAVSAMQLVVVVDGEVVSNRFQAGGLQPLLNALTEGDYNKHGEVLAKLRSGEHEQYPDYILDDMLNDLGSQVSRGIQMYQSNAVERGFAALFLINTGAMIPVLQDMVAAQVSFPVHVLNPFEHFPLPDKLSHLHAHGPRFVEALGLALRSYAPWHI